MRVTGRFLAVFFRGLIPHRGLLGGTSPVHTHEYSTIDTHTAGMPTRVVVDGLDVPGERGTSVRERRDRFAETMDDVRRFLVCEPRGHADMFAAVPLTPGDPEADLGLFFMDADGYLDMCGHATIGAITALVEDERLDVADSIVIETPSGLVTTHARVEDDRIVEVTFENVPSAFVDTRSVDGGRHGMIDVDIVSAGNVCAILDATSVGLTLPDSSASKVAAIGTVVRDLVNEDGPFTDPVSDRALDVSIVQFTDASDPKRTAVVFGDGTVDRSPCGTGTSARMTLFGHCGELPVDEPFTHVGPTGESFSGRILDSTDDVYRTAVTGSAHVIGHHTFLRHATDPLDAFTFD